jgi:hypothetical protein
MLLRIILFERWPVRFRGFQEAQPQWAINGYHAFLRVIMPFIQSWVKALMPYEFNLLALLIYARDFRYFDAF